MARQARAELDGLFDRQAVLAGGFGNVDRGDQRGDEDPHRCLREMATHADSRSESQFSGVHGRRTTKRRLDLLDIINLPASEPERAHQERFSGAAFIFRGESLGDELLGVLVHGRVSAHRVGVVVDVRSKHNCQSRSFLARGGKRRK